MFVTRQACISNIRLRFIPQLLQQLKKLICDLCRLYNLPQHPDVEMLDQPLPAGPVGPDRKARLPDALSSSHRPWRANGLVFDCGWKVYIYRHGTDRGKPSLLMFTAEPAWPASQLASVWWGACSEQINSLCLWSPAARGTVPYRLTLGPSGSASSYVTSLVLVDALIYELINWCVDLSFSMGRQTRSLLRKRRRKRWER